jgi:hypothetical protein
MLVGVTHRLHDGRSLALTDRLTNTHLQTSGRVEVPANE